MNGSLVVAIVFSLSVFAFLFTAAYHWLMFGPNITVESLIEAFNYSLQTITTVGYGNWVPASWDISKAELQTRILYVERFVTEVGSATCQRRGSTNDCS